MLTFRANFGSVCVCRVWVSSGVCQCVCVEIFKSALKHEHVAAPTNNAVFEFGEGVETVQAKTPVPSSLNHSARLLVVVFRQLVLCHGLPLQRCIVIVAGGALLVSTRVLHIVRARLEVAHPPTPAISAPVLDES